MKQYNIKSFLFCLLLLFVNQVFGQRDTKVCKTLIIIGDDRSGSTSAIRKLTAIDYRNIMQTINDKGSGTLSVVLIGNPQPGDQQNFFQKFNELKPVSTSSIKNPTLSQRGQLERKNKATDDENNKIRCANAECINKFQAIITEKVINYTYANHDCTDINAALEQINTIINQSIYEKYDKIIIALLSDGINQPHYKTIEPVTTKISCRRPFTLYTIGWKDQTIFKYISNKECLASKDDLIETIKNISCN